jgi:hypothetical protein
MTGVSATLTAEHRLPGGEFHEHTWEITAWFCDNGSDARFLRRQLDEIVKRYHGGKLPDELHRGEALARSIRHELTSDWYGRECLLVEVRRPLERIHARWPA